jgi:trehalose 6-phosphate phosphatase
VSDIDRLLKAAGDAGIFCDFDGCLAPIIPDPEAAKAVRGATATLERLARRFKVVAVVSGRSAADLSRRVRARGVRLLGLHGMEDVRDGAITVVPEAEAAREAVEATARSLGEALRGVRGAVLEHKGLALAVHFRRAADPEEAERTASPLVHDTAARNGLIVVPGRRILEVRPAGGGDKGDAVRRVIAAESLAAAMVAGDDVGDLPAFAALDELDARVRVAVASDEAPAELVERADLVLGSPAEFVSLLRRLAR